MTLSQLMASHNPSADYEGWVTNDDFVLAVDCGAVPVGEITPQSAAGFAVAELGVTGLDSQLNPITQEKTYIRAGQSTMKTGNQRGFKLTADRYVGDDFQDFCLSGAVKYGTGSAVVRKYVYFNILTGKGECGELAIIVNSDGSGEAGESAEIELELKKSGASPTDYTYSAAV
ncbi:MAG: hypothetical protein HUJ65_03935 [Oscillospiraceae bacterium]|nr:hypothetical protein [Oscillospiraceae bacterium]